MKVYIPHKQRNKTIWLGPYRFRLSVSKVQELILLGSYIELESEELQLALMILRDLQEPFRTEFAKVVDAHLTAQRILQELQISLFIS
jgi:hypothetical protein